MTNIWDNCYDRCIYIHIYTVYCIRNESFVTTFILQLFIFFSSNNYFIVLINRKRNKIQYVL